jgi:hypothetical protein
VREGGTRKRSAFLLPGRWRTPESPLTLCSFAISLPDLDLVLDGTATRVTDAQTLVRVAQSFAARGWPLEVAGEDVTASFWAPTAPPPPWHLHRFKPRTALGVATASAGGATRWHFTPAR